MPAPLASCTRRNLRGWGKAACQATPHTLQRNPARQRPLGRCGAAVAPGTFCTRCHSTGASHRHTGSRRPACAGPAGPRPTVSQRRRAAARPPRRR
eukprot:15481398-Alexandrium_andersonii.AAC.1